MAARTDLFTSPDYFNVDELLTEEQKLIRESVRSYVKKEISPIIEDYAQKAEFPQQIVKQLGDLGCFGPTIPAEYGGGGLDYISYGLMMQELERGDSGVRSTASVQGSLVMFPIYQYGSEEQRKVYLPKLANGEWLGCFGLTEPNHGSDPSNMLSNFKDAGDHVILNGAKIAFRSQDLFSQFLTLGIVSKVGFEAAVNIGVSIGCLPTKGLPLPFVSYGGSALIFNMVAIGLLLNVSRIKIENGG
jgi:glutaryl-CoA dehydrogenase